MQSRRSQRCSPETSSRRHLCKMPYIVRHHCWRSRSSKSCRALGRRTRPSHLLLVPCIYLLYSIKNDILFEYRLLRKFCSPGFIKWEIGPRSEILCLKKRREG